MPKALVWRTNQQLGEAVRAAREAAAEVGAAEVSRTVHGCASNDEG